MTDEPRKRPPTLSDQLAAYREIIMAQVTKPARSGSQSVTFGKRAVGAKQDELYLKDLTLVQREDEDDMQWLGRTEALLNESDNIEIRFNAGRIERELQATLEKGATK
jgi:hypothetical protein